MYLFYGNRGRISKFMKKNDNVAIVVPIYTQQLNENEIISLNQLEKIFIKNRIIAVVPFGLYVDMHLFDSIERFPQDFFTNVESYNRLMLSKDFYKRFQQYEYILIYQLDAFVFSDQLSYFCSLGYDYIGAPWLYGIFNYIDSSHYLWYVGNGGLSLRKVSGFIRVLEERKPLLGEQIKNEDLFFSSIVDEGFKVAPIEVALQFSHERQVQKCFQLNHDQLPFGCHAWERYDLDFWKFYIEQYGHRVSIAENVGNEDKTRKSEYSLWEKFSNIVLDDEKKQQANKWIQLLFNQHDNNCIIFGAGFYGNSFSKYFMDIGIKVRFFCDNDSLLDGKTLNGISIINSDKLLDKKEDSLIVIINYQYENEITEQLKSMSFEYKKDFITLTDLINLLYKDG